jgi:ABC-type multidrug transport system ATPase subunit
MTTAAIELRDALCLAGRYPLLAGVDLVVAQGELVAIAGPNGAGKTSLLRLCAGLLSLSGGTGRVLGFDLYVRSTELRQQVGLLASSSGLYEDLTPVENLAWVAKCLRRPQSAIRQAAERFGVGGRWARERTRHCSTGQRRRTELACLAVRDPMLWLLDEPHSGLDVDGRFELDRMMSELAAEGKAVVYVTHEPQLGTGGPLRKVVLAGGRVVADLRQAPSSGGLRSEAVFDVV